MVTPVAIFIIGILLTVLAADAVTFRESNRTTEAFNSRGRTRAEAVESRMRELTLKLQNLTAFVSAPDSGLPNPDEWNRFIDTSEMGQLDELPLVAFVEVADRADMATDLEVGFDPSGTGTGTAVAAQGEVFVATRIHNNGVDMLDDMSTSAPLERAGFDMALDLSGLEIAHYLTLSDDSRRSPLFFELDNDFFHGYVPTSTEAESAPLTSPESRTAFAMPVLEPSSDVGDDPEAWNLRGWVVGVVDTEAILAEEAGGTPFRVQMDLLEGEQERQPSLVSSYSPDGLQLNEAAYRYSGEARLAENLWRFHAFASSDFSAPGPLLSPIVSVVGLLSTMMVTLGASLRLRAAHRTREMRELVDQTNEAARTDDLTGLANRSGLIEALHQAMAQSDTDRPAAALFMDLNRFKNINDTMGHSAGDELLRQVGQRLESQVRPDETLARFGGDEFVLVSPQLNSEADARAKALKMMKSLDAPFDLPSGATKVSMAVGIALATSSSDHSPESLLRDADLAMYRAKRRNERIGLFDASMRNDAVSRMEIERQLQNGLEDLRVLYQPIVDSTTGRVTTVEALVRWDRPGVGLVSPAEFLDVVAEAGLVDELGMLVLTQATAEVADRNRAHPHEPPTSLAVNVVLSQLLDPDFLHEVANVLEASGLAPELLTLELSEDIAIEHLSGVLRILRPLSRLGITLSIDDFGTGNTSLAHLTRLDQISELKIDGSFIGDLPSDLAAEALVRGMLTIARQLDLHVVAEGVETVDIYRACTALGIPSLQGYLLSRPCELDAIPSTVALPAIAESSAGGGATPPLADERSPLHEVERWNHGEAVVAPLIEN